MKALIAKEFFECRKLALLGGCLWSLVLMLACVAYSRELDQLIRNAADGPTRSFLPLANPDALLLAAFFCAILAAALGGWQLFTERQRNLWSCLVHRPMTPTAIFAAKSIAGLALYFAATGLPLAAFVLWNRSPGNVAGPFDWSMVVPWLLFCLAGVPYYFAAMLTGVRQARWYASRTLGLGAALITTGAMLAAPHLWQALVAIGLGATILATASWAAFHTNGEDRAQPAPGKPALALALALGWTVVVFFAATLAADFAGRFLGYPPRTYYTLMKDGTVLKVSQTRDGANTISDLRNKPVLHPKTGLPISTSDLHGLVAPSYQVLVPSSAAPLPGQWIAQSMPVRGWCVSGGTLWFQWEHYGRLAGYDLRTRRFIGSIGPNGFDTTLAGHGDRFAEVQSRIMIAPDGVYSINLHNRTTRKIFGALPDDPVLAATEVERDSESKYLLVVTRKSIRLSLPTGEEVVQTPFAPGLPDYRQVAFYPLEPAGHYAFWIQPTPRSRGGINPGLPIRALFFTGQLETRGVDLPPPALPETAADAELKTMSVGLPPVAVALASAVLDSIPPAQLQAAQRISLTAAALMCLPALWLMRRNRFPVVEQAAWIAFLALFGIPGFLAFLSAQSWPAREPCPTCSRRRVVTHERCEHCGARFSPGDKKGTEIFEPVPVREHPPVPG